MTDLGIRAATSADSACGRSNVKTRKRDWMTTLHLRRPYDAGAVLRRIWVTVDERRVAGLWPGQSISLNIEGGPRIVQAAMDWIRSEPLSVQLGDAEAVALEVSFPVRAYWRTWVKPRTALKIRRSPLPPPRYAS